MSLGLNAVPSRSSPASAPTCTVKVAITLAYVGSVIAESNASNYGIGNLITRACASLSPRDFDPLTHSNSAGKACPGGGRGPG